MRVALCFSGHTRNVRQYEKEITEKVINRLPNVDIFGQVETDHGTFNFPNFKFKKLLLEDPLEVKEFFGLDKNFDIPDRPWYTEAKPIYNIRMFHNVQSSIKLAKEYEIVNSFKYDFIIRARWDMVPLIPLDDISNFRQDTLYLPKSDNWFGLNDKFAIGSSEIMEIYGLRGRMLSEFANSSLPLKSETYLKWLVDRYRMKVSRLDFAQAVDRYGYYEKPCYFDKAGDFIDDQVIELEKQQLVRIIRPENIVNGYIRLA